jgi:hypothetical protein
MPINRHPSTKPRNSVTPPHRPRYSPIPNAATAHRTDTKAVWDALVRPSDDVDGGGGRISHFTSQSLIDRRAELMELFNPTRITAEVSSTRLADQTTAYSRNLDNGQKSVHPGSVMTAPGVNTTEAFVPADTTCCKRSMAGPTTTKRRLGEQTLVVVHPNRQAACGVVPEFKHDGRAVCRI